MRSWEEKYSESKAFFFGTFTFKEIFFREKHVRINKSHKTNPCKQYHHHLVTKPKVINEWIGIKMKVVSIPK